ncbi:MAG TPA: PDZ domain-containing protein [Gemmatimonadales bacterium]|nr:PDZ domain-containing protein [Gemmatimonadales bacterium]
MRPKFLPGLLFAISATFPLAAQTPRAAPGVSAPVANLRYEVTFDSASAARRALEVSLTADVRGPGPMLLSFPTWTPGSYEIANFARFVTDFSAVAGGKALDWDKLDHDTWRIDPAGARTVTVRFDYRAAVLDNAAAWSRPDFAFVNGTNIFPYPEGRGFDFPATVTVKTQPGWQVATGMQSAGGAGSYRETNYHDLVDKPMFIGRFDLDSMQVDGRWNRLATYPAGAMSGPGRSLLWDQIARTVPPMAAVFQETPWRTYTTLLVFTREVGGGSALEHANSHIGIYNPGFIGNPLLASITDHEIFHAWNVKRLRPADLWPYVYARPQPTPWLWVSEGITDYYADLALVRGGVVDSAGFLGLTGEKMERVAAEPVAALEDASLSTWIQPVDGSHYQYYPKGSLAGFMLDVLIRDGSDNRRSLDHVLRELYQATYKKGRGFTGADWWAAVSRAAGGRSFDEFNARYIDGREPFPWEEILPRAGLRMVSDTLREPQVGLATIQDSAGGILVERVLPGGVAEAAGVKEGDQLIALGDVEIMDPGFAAAFRERFGMSEGDSLSIRVRRGADTLTLNGVVRLITRVETRLDVDPNASEKATRIRSGIFKGTVSGAPGSRAR